MTLPWTCRCRQCSGLGPTDREMGFPDNYEEPVEPPEYDPEIRYPEPSMADVDLLPLADDYDALPFYGDDE